jgi:hypothetical protein
MQSAVSIQLSVKIIRLAKEELVEIQGIRSFVTPRKPDSKAGQMNTGLRFN